MAIYLVELGAHDGSSLLTLRVATGSYVTRPGDSPANTVYRGRVADPGNFEAYLYSAGRTAGPSEVGYGEVVVNNPDGEFDGWIDYGFDGRAIRVLRVDSATASYASASVLFVGVIEQIVTTTALRQFRFRIYDRRLDLDKPLQTERYAGTTTSGGNSAEGNLDLKDQIKPLVFGKAFNVPLINVNTQKLLYQASASEISSALVYDRGAPLTYSANYASIALLNSATIVPGKYGTCNALGLVRLGAPPDGPVTADVTEGSSSADRTAAQIVKRMLEKMGFTSSDYVDATFSALDALNSSECGIYIDSDMHGIDAAQRVLASVGGYIAPNTLGEFEVGRLSAPGSPTATLNERDMLGEIEFLGTNDDGGGVPAYRVLLKYQPVWLVQGDEDIAGCQDDMDFRSFVGNEWREEKAESLSVLTKYPRSPELKQETLLADKAAATAEAERRLALYSSRRDRLRIKFKSSDVESIKKGDTVSVVISRLGYDLGRSMVVTGMRQDHLDEHTILELWG